MKVRLIKEGGTLAPFDSESEEWLNAKQSGQYFEANVSTPRNYEFHKKYFALLNATFEYWQPLEVKTRWGLAEKSKEQYRNDLTILAGFYTLRPRLRGEPVAVPKSISFANMSEDEFAVVYDKTVNAIIKYVLLGWTIEQVDELVGTFL